MLSYLVQRLASTILVMTLVGIFVFLLLHLSAGDPAAPAANSPAAARAELARLRAQDPDATAREITKLEYALTRSLMKAGGLDDALGGEAKAEAALDDRIAAAWARR